MADIRFFGNWFFKSDRVQRPLVNSWGSGRFTIEFRQYEAIRSPFKTEPYAHNFVALVAPDGTVLREFHGIASRRDGQGYWNVAGAGTDDDFLRAYESAPGETHTDRSGQTFILRDSPYVGRPVVLVSGEFSEIAQTWGKAVQITDAINPKLLWYKNDHAQGLAAYQYDTQETGNWQNSNSIAQAFVRYGLGITEPVVTRDMLLSPGWQHDAVRRGFTSPFAKPEEVRCFVAGTMIDMADGTEKPIETVEAGDWVMSYDENEDGGRGALKPARVTRLFRNTARHVLDVYGLKVTPGHVTLCGDGPFAGRHVPIIDILRSDGAMVDRYGNLVRATTNCPVGSRGDQFVWAISGRGSEDGGILVSDKRRLRLGTRFIGPDGSDISIIEVIDAQGWVVTHDGLLKRDAHADFGAPFWWSWSDRLPNPEDYILQRSRLVNEDIFEPGEWWAAQTLLAPPSRDAAAEHPPAVSASGVSGEAAVGTRDAASGPNRSQRRAAKAAVRAATRRKFRGETLH